MLHIGAAILGAIGGVFVGIALYNLLFFYSAPNTYLLTALCVFGAIIMAFLSFHFYDAIVILSTAFVGSYTLVRGSSLFIGYFPSEYGMIMKFAEGAL